MGQYALSLRASSPIWAKRAARERNAPRGRERVVDQDLGFGARQQGKKKK